MKGYTQDKAITGKKNRHAPGFFISERQPESAFTSVVIRASAALS
jgi:hypothetical protein